MIEETSRREQVQAHLAQLDAERPGAFADPENLTRVLETLDGARRVEEK